MMTNSVILRNFEDKYECVGSLCWQWMASLNPLQFKTFELVEKLIMFVLIKTRIIIDHWSLLFELKGLNLKEKII